MTQEPTSTYRMTAFALTSIDPTKSYLMRESDEVCAGWKMVKPPARGQLWIDKTSSENADEPNRSVSTNCVVVTFADGTEHYLNPDDPVEIAWR